MDEERALQTPKVFCVGWHKTGTSSMGLALIRLGYKVVGARLDTADDLRHGRIDRVLSLAKSFDGFQDVPWAALYKELDSAFPGSRFILVERDEDDWLRSASTHFKDTNVALHEWLYGVGEMAGNEALYLERYKRHNAEVKEYFSGRDDFLEFSIERGDGWDKLCQFLSRPVPSIPFPFENKGPHSFSLGDQVLTTVREMMPLSLRRAIFRMRLYLRKKRGLPDPRDRFHNFEANRRSRSGG
jgi:hypothetical protein